MPSVSSKLIQGVFEPNTYSILWIQLTHTTAGLLFWLLKFKSKCSTVLQLQAVVKFNSPWC